MVLKIYQTLLVSSNHIFFKVAQFMTYTPQKNKFIMLYNVDNVLQDLKKLLNF